MTHIVSDATPLRDASFDVERMALYSLERAQQSLDGLSNKSTWTPQDTASFDCMHYLGDKAIDTCAKALQLQPGDHVLDIGAGFNATGRYLNRRHAVSVTGVELQPRIHAMGETITAHTGQSAHVHSVNANFITAPQTVLANESADHIVSFLCILHIPQRESLFARAASTLKPGGRMYLEDFYAKHPLPEYDARALQDVVSCPYLPSIAQYEKDLMEAGFEDVRVEDVSAPWTMFVTDRAAQYHATVGKEASLDTFYTVIADLFGRGNVGGARISARRANR